MPALDVARQLTGHDLVALAPELRAERQVQRRPQADLDLSGEVHVPGELTETQRPGVDTGLIRDPGIVRIAEDAVEPRRAGGLEARTQRHVHRVAEVVIEVVVTVREAGVPGPRAGQAPKAARGGPVGRLPVELREVAQRIDVGPVALAQAIAAIAVAGSVPVAVSAERVELSGS